MIFGLADMSNHFELVYGFVSFNPSTMERIDQGQMRSIEMPKYSLRKWIRQGVPVLVQGVEGDTTSFHEYLLEN